MPTPEEIAIVAAALRKPAHLAAVERSMSIPQGGPSLREFHPTWADRLGALVAGDERGGGREHLARALFGSAGAGPSGPGPGGSGLLDLVPVAGQVLQGQAARQHDEAFGTAMAALPAAGPAMRAGRSAWNVLSDLPSAMKRRPAPTAPPSTTTSPSLGGEPPPPMGHNRGPALDPIETPPTTAAAPAGRQEAITAVSLRNLPADEAARIAQSGRHIIPKEEGGFVGAPIDVRNKEDLQAMRDRFDALVEEGAAGAGWYKDVQGAIKQLAGPDPAKQTRLAHELAQTSAQATPDTNMGFALRMHNAYESGKPVDIARTGQIAQSYREARERGENVKLGKKTDIYARHMDPTREDPVTGTNDIWHARSFGYKHPDGTQWDAALTPQQHAFMDAETVLAVQRANARKLGGRSDWTAGEIQASPWVTMKGRGLQEQFGWSPEKAMEEAVKTYKDYVNKYSAHATFETIPFAQGRHLQDLATAPAREREAFAGRSARQWTGPGGRDILYDALGRYVGPTRKAQGMYTPPGGQMEMQPASVTSPLISIEGDPGLKRVAPFDRATLNAAEATRAMMDVQGSGGWHKALPNRPGVSGSLAFPSTGAMSPSAMEALKAVGERHGLPDIVDTGAGVTMTRFGKQPPDPKETAQAIKRGLLGEAEGIVGGGAPMRVEVQSGRIPYEKQWEKEEGTGSVVRAWSKYFNDPSIDGGKMIGMLDASEPLRAKAAALLADNEAMHQRTGMPIRKDVQNMLRILADPKERFSGLLRALQRKEFLPAAVMGVLPALLGEEQTRAGGA